MLVISELQDFVEINASASNKKQMVYEMLNQKYLDKYVEELGICMYINKEIEILEYEIVGSLLIANVNFSIIFQRFYEDEICNGKIISMSEDGITISDSIFNNYFCSFYNLFSNCEFENIGYQKWIWNYKGNRLILRVGNDVMFKIKSVKSELGLVEVAMNETGLGPITWW